MKPVRGVIRFCHINLYKIQENFSFMTSLDKKLESNAEKHQTLNIEYDFKTSKSKITGDVKKENRSDIIATFLSLQTGKGKDESKANEKDVYKISIRWYPEGDKFEATYDTGNKGLRDGILYHVLGQMK